MDETQHFCLRWNNYQSSITSAFENLRDDEDFVDVTLACEGRSIKAHRVVLSACSPYFRDLLKSTPCKHPVILLQNVNFLDLHSLVEFIYHGEVNVHQKSLQSFLKTAEVLRVSGLTQQQAEETHSQLAQIQNLENAGIRTPLNSHNSSLHDEASIFARNVGPSPPSPQIPSASSQINTQLFKRNIAAAMMRRERNNSAPSAEDSNAIKRMRGSVGDNGFPTSNNNSPDIMHARSASPQLTPADFSTIKHNNNNTPPLKEEKRNGSNAGNINNGNGGTNGNGLTSSEKVGGCSLTASPLTRGTDDVKSEPMELVCSNNNPPHSEEHSNDSTGENEVNRSSSVDGGKGSLSSGNDEEIENSMPPHPQPPFLMSPADTKLFPPPQFSFPITNLAEFSHLQNAAEMATSPQGGSTNLLGGVIVPGALSTSQQQQQHLLHHHHHHHSTSSTTSHHQLHHHHQQQHLQHNRSSELSSAQDDDAHDKSSMGHKIHSSSTPSPLHQQPSPHHPLYGHQQQQLSLSMLPSHHLHHDLSPGSHHHHHHLGRTNSPLDHHHLLHHRRASLSPSPTGRSSTGGSAAGILSSNRGSEVGPHSRLLLPLPLNACHRCDVCGKLLSTKLTLKRHKEQQHLQPLNNAVCNLCHKVFRTLNSLNNHKSIYHRRQKNHHSYFHHGSGVGVGGNAPGSRLHQSLSSLGSAGNTNAAGGNAVSVAAAAAAAAAAELLLSPMVGAAAAVGGGNNNSGPTSAQLSAHQQLSSSPNVVKPCIDFL